ncbi:MAG: DNA methyltransferase, partial [Alphaproteobacteria bacterium]|nr:DNA methyltransferase [Alphaproteobacteria bacterium]
ERIVKVHSSPGDMLLDFFAGSGTFGEAAARHGRACLLVDNNPEAVRIMERRLARFAAEVQESSERLARYSSGATGVGVS